MLVKQIKHWCYWLWNVQQQTAQPWLRGRHRMWWGQAKLPQILPYSFLYSCKMRRKENTNKLMYYFKMCFWYWLCENTWGFQQVLSGGGWKLSRQMTPKWPSMISCYCSLKTVSVCYHCVQCLSTVSVSVSVTICKYTACSCQVCVCVCPFACVRVITFFSWMLPM